jgi:hypothetical protein
MADGNPQTGEISFTNRHKVPLLAGDYEITITQTLSAPQIATDTFHAKNYFSVRGARFSFDSGEVAAVFPPANNRGEYDHTLPHVVLTRRTLPWERSLDLADDGSPWLAVLVFEQEEAPALTSCLVGDLLRDAFSHNQDDAATPSSLGADTVSYPDAFGQLDDKHKRPFTLDWGEHVTDPVQVIDVPLDLFAAIAPSEADLDWLTHVRTVASHKKAGGDGSAQDNALVVGNRLPRENSACVAHLVSLEGMAALLPADDTYAPAPPLMTSSGTPATKVRLVSLQSWKFTSVDPKETFDQYLLNLDQGPLCVPFDSAMAADAAAADTIRRAFDLGYTAMPHSSRIGDRTVSWYRGPLLPFATETKILPTPPDPDATMIEAADQATRFDPETGMMDISYAAAWEAGRLLALQSPLFGPALYNFKCAATQAMALSVEHEQLAAHFTPLMKHVADAGLMQFEVHPAPGQSSTRVADGLKAALAHLLVTRLSVHLAPGLETGKKAGP